MPRYFFHVRKGSHPPDSMGVDLLDIETAQREAAEIMGRELKDDPDAFWNDEEWHIEVTDGLGLILFTLYSSAIRSAAGKAVAAPT